VTARSTDRYVRRGGPVPQIYAGTLAGLAQAMSDAKSESRFLPGALITVTAVQGKFRKRIRAYQAGREQASA
jgi:hypothetical protein